MKNKKDKIVYKDKGYKHLREFKNYKGFYSEYYNYSLYPDDKPNNENTIFGIKTDTNTFSYHSKFNNKFHFKDVNGLVNLKYKINEKNNTLSFDIPENCEYYNDLIKNPFIYTNECYTYINFYENDKKIKITFKTYNITKSVNSLYKRKNTKYISYTIDKKYGNFILYTGTNKKLHFNKFSVNDLNITYKSIEIEQYLSSLLSLENYKYFYINEGINPMVKLIYINYIVKNNIKSPNNIDIFRKMKSTTGTFLSISDIRKNDNNIIKTYLNKHDIYTPFLVKKYNLKFYSASPFKFFKFIFGNDWVKYLSSINDEAFDHIFINNQYLTPYEDLTPLTKSEILCLISVINDFDTHNKRRELHISYIIDHLKMIKKLKDYGINKQITQRSFKHFDEEHLKLSNEISLLKQKYIPERIYKEDIINIINNYSTVVNDVLINFKLLTTKNDFNNESKCLHHCVAGYINYSESNIISIQSNNSRSTLEIGQDLTVRQHRSYYNGQPNYEHIQSVNNLVEYLKLHFTNNEFNFIVVQNLNPLYRESVVSETIEDPFLMF